MTNQQVALAVSKPATATIVTEARNNCQLDIMPPRLATGGPTPIGLTL